jgi:hypothetical protein
LAGIKGLRGPLGFTSTVRTLHVQWITSGCATQDYPSQDSV